MNVSSVGSTQPSVPAPQGVDSKRAQLQMALLQKILQSQQDQATQIFQELQGKGQVIDIRV